MEAANGSQTQTVGMVRAADNRALAFGNLDCTLRNAALSQWRRNSRKPGNSRAV
jgi:hypothetical protein